MCLRRAAPREHQRILSALSPAVLGALAELVKEVDGEQQLDAKRASPMRMHIISCGKGYLVKRGWNSFFVETAQVIRSLEAAIEIYTFINDMRAAALRRPDVNQIPLRQDELDNLLKHAKLIPLNFFSDHRTASHRFQTPRGPDLAKALAWRKQVKAILASPRCTDARLAELKRDMLSHAQRQRQAESQRLSHLRATVQRFIEKGGRSRRHPSTLRELTSGRREPVREELMLALPKLHRRDIVEAQAWRALQGEKVSRETVQDVLRKVAAIITPSHRRKNIIKDGQPVKSETFGLYCYAGSVGITNETKMLPNFVRLLNTFFQQEGQGADFSFTSLTVNVNVECSAHVDSNNMGPSKITAFGKYKKGRLWLQNAEGDAVCPDKSASAVGVLHDIRSPNWCLFDGNTLHCTEPFKGGSRISLVFYTVRNWVDATTEVREQLLKYAFVLPRAQHMIAMGGG